MIVEHGADGALQFPRMIIIFLIKKTFFDKPNLYVQATIYRPSLCRLNPPSHCLRARETSSSARGSQREFLPQIWWDVICRFAWKCWETRDHIFRAHPTVHHSPLKKWHKQLSCSVTLWYSLPQFSTSCAPFLKIASRCEPLEANLMTGAI